MSFVSLKRLAREIYLLGLRAPALVIVIACLAGAWGLMTLGHLQYSAQGYEHLPIEHPLRKISEPIHRHFQPVERVYIVLENPPGGRPFVLKSLGEIFARALEDDRFVERVLNRIDDLPRHRDFRGEAGGILDILRADDIPDLEKALSPQEIQRALSMRRTPSLVATPVVESGEDPLGLFAGLQKLYDDELLPGKFRLEAEYLFSDDRTLLTIILEPPKASSDITFSLRLYDFLEESWEVLLQQEPMAESVRLHLLGPHIDVARDARGLRASLWSAFGIALFASFIIWIVAYRRSVIVFSIVLPTLLSGLILAALQSELNAMQLALLISLIVMILHGCIFAHDRYIQEAVATPDRLKGALRRALRGLSPPFLYGSVFLAFCAGASILFDPTGLVVSPIMVLAGVLGLLFAAIWINPAMLKVLVARSRRRSISRHFSTFGARHIAWGALAYPRAWLALVILATFGLLFGAAKGTIGQIPMRDDLRPFTTTKGRSYFDDSSASVRQTLSIPDKELIIATGGMELEAALQANDRLYGALQKNRDVMNIRELESVARTLPSVAVQQQARARLLSSDIINVPRLRNILAAEATTAGLQFTPLFQRFLDRIEQIREAASQKPALRWNDVSETDMQRAHSEFLVAENSYYYVMTRLWGEKELSLGVSMEEWEKLGGAIGAPIYVASKELEQAALNRERIKVAIILFTLEWIFLGLVLGALARSFSWGMVPWFASLLWGLWCWGAVDILQIEMRASYVAALHGLFLVFAFNLCFMVQRIWECTTERVPGEPEVAAFYRAVNTLGRPITINLLVVFFLCVGLVSLASSEFQDFGILGAVASGFGVMIILVVLPCACYLSEITALRGDLISFDDPRPLLRLRSEDWAAAEAAALAENSEEAASEIPAGMIKNA